MQEINIKSTQRSQIIDVTNEVVQALMGSGVKNGLCVIYCPHTTAAVTINENSDPDVKSDIIEKLSALLPKIGDYAHSEGNSDAHIKASLMGNSRIVLIKAGKLLLGVWEGIMFCEFDGPRTRRIIVSFLGE